MASSPDCVSSRISEASSNFSSRNDMKIRSKSDPGNPGKISPTKDYPLHSLVCLYFSAFYYCLSCLVFLTKIVFVFSMSFCVFLMGLFRPLFGCIYNRFKHILCSKNCGLQRDLILDCRNRRPARWPSPRPIYLSDRESFFLFRCIGLNVLLL